MKLTGFLQICLPLWESHNTGSSLNSFLATPYFPSLPVPSESPSYHTSVPKIFYWPHLLASTRFVSLLISLPSPYMGTRHGKSVCTRYRRQNCSSNKCPWCSQAPAWQATGSRDGDSIPHPPSSPRWTGGAAGRSEQITRLPLTLSPGGKYCKTQRFDGFPTSSDPEEILRTLIQTRRT